MTINYTLSKSTCLDFFKNYLMKTKHFKNIFLKYLFVLIALIILFFVSYKYLLAKAISFFLTLFLIFNIKRLLITSFCERFKRNPENFSPIFFNDIILNISENTIILISKYKNVSIPLSKITGIYVLENFIFITNSVSKDILIPLNTFETEIEKSKFLNIFKGLDIQYSFPYSYNFV